MSDTLKKLQATLMPILGMLVAAAIFIVGIFFLSYILIIAAIIGLAAFCYACIRNKWMKHKQPQQQPSRIGRTIDQNDIK